MMRNLLLCQTPSRHLLGAHPMNALRPSSPPPRPPGGRRALRHAAQTLAAWTLAASAWAQTVPTWAPDTFYAAGTVVSS